MFGDISHIIYQKSKIAVAVRNRFRAKLANLAGMKYVLISILFLAGLPAGAQTSFGPAVALNFASQQRTAAQGSSRITPAAGFQAGVFGNLRVNEQIGLHAEILYSLEGRKERLTTFNVPGHVSLHYLRIPILLQYYATENLYVEAGPNPGFFLSGREKWGNQTTNLSRDIYRPVDFGLAIGAGYDLSDYLPGLTAGVRFTFGLTNMVRENISAAAGTDFRNRVLSLTIRYALPFE